MIERYAHMPAALKANARWERLGESRVPALLVHPDWEGRQAAPIVIWMHGRTANKELDPGRYLRWMRAGMAACAIDLPGHGERFDATYQDGSRTPEIINQVVRELDEVVTALRSITHIDVHRAALGGMSAGGMAALARLCQPHDFCCASVEATTGAWDQHFRPEQGLDFLNPIANLNTWKEIPLQVFHARGDQMISYASQTKFIDALKRRYSDPTLIEFVAYEHTGAAAEHIGFGRFAADAKDRQRDFFRRWLQPGAA